MADDDAALDAPPPCPPRRAPRAGRARRAAAWRCLREGIRGQREARQDGAAEEEAVRVDDVHGRGRAQVHDDDRRAVDAPRRPRRPAVGRSRPGRAAGARWPAGWCWRRPRRAAGRRPAAASSSRSVQRSTTLTATMCEAWPRERASASARGPRRGPRADADAVSSRAGGVDRAALDERGLDGAVAEVHRDDHAAMIPLRLRRGARLRPATGRRSCAAIRSGVSCEQPAKFFVNSGLVSNPVDIYHLLRPLLRQTVAYRYLRGGKVVAHGTGWVERIVADRPDVSSFFTPLSICLSVASWEHLEFETRPDQLIAYMLVQGDERVVLQFVPHRRRRRRGGRPGAAAVPDHARLHPDGAQRARRRGAASSSGRRAGGRRRYARAATGPRLSAARVRWRPDVRTNRAA